MKKKTIIYLVIFLIIFALLITLIVLKKHKNKTEPISTKAVEEKISKVGSYYYKNYYYKNLSDKTVLKAFVDNGISIPLYDIASYKSIDKELDKLYNNEIINFLNENKCNLDRTKIYIMPKDPFGEKDFSISIYFDCNFN